ncbi:PAS domain S-box-containing protein [Pseudoduganella lurida]|uniref:Sensory/regulatory protein RpfC n=1 Tax=Pseudoduganella lurida TaxID=1036180 RepID=A0A562RKD8_9BURK|nr:CHASE domain-containing protein [Pseudoduganella lurida]TWI69518.1 PAS domain S-box-containing protein [Pseudoduganella lurida]
MGRRSSTPAGDGAGRSPARPRMPPGRVLPAGLLCLFLYVLAAAACLALAVPTGNNSPVWLPTGIALWAVLRWRRPMLVPVGAGSLLVNLYLMAAGPGLAGAAALPNTAAAVAISAGNVAAVAAAAWAVRYGRSLLRAHHPLIVYGYIVVVALAAIASAGIGGAALAVAGIVPQAEAVQVAMLWWLGDVLAMLLVTPLLAAWSSRSALRRIWQARGTVLALPALLALTAGATLLVFRLEAAGTPDWLPFLLLVPLVWAAFRHGAPAGSAAAVIAGAGAVWATLAGGGPFATRDQFHSMLALQIYLALLAVTAMVVANTAAGQPGARQGGRPARSPVVTLALCLAITVAAWHGIATYSEHRIREQFRASVDTAWRQMDYRMANYRRLLRAGKAFFDAAPAVTRQQWLDYVADFDLARAFPGTLGLGYATWLREDMADDFVARQRVERPAFRIWPTPRRWPAAVVTYMEPGDARNLRAAGFDMMSETIRRTALLATARSAAIGSTGTVTLVQDGGRGSQQGFLMFVPVYAPGADIAGSAARAVALRGFVYSPFRVGEMVDSMVGAADAFTLRIVDLHDGPPGRAIYSNDTADWRGMRYVRPLVQQRMLPIDEAGHRWQLSFTATARFEAAVDRQSALLTLGLGALISFLLFEIVRGLASTRARALAMAQRITRELQHEQRATRQSEERFRLFTASVASHAIIFLDGAGRVEAWNGGAANLFGYPDALAAGGAARLWADPAQARALLADASRAGTATAVAAMARADGGRFFGELQLDAVQRDGELAGFALIVRDVTAARAAEEQLRQAVAIAESASRAKSAFVANMSHELRTPMNGVLGTAALLGRSRLDKEQRDLVNMIRSSGETLLAVLNDILDFAKIEAGKVGLAVRPVALDDIALACARLMAVTGGGRLRLLVDVDPALPPVVLADPLRLEQILTNLVGNALKFTERGSVACRFTAGPARAGLPTLQVAVSDTGIGIDPAQLKSLFSAFAQADDSTTRRFGGTGLGLTIARSLAELMDGTLDVASTPGEGSTFTLTVPLALPADGAAAADPYALPAAQRGLQVLLCEPDAELAAALGHATARWDWQPHAVADMAALDAALAAPGPLPFALLLAGPGAAAAPLLRALAAQRARLPAGFGVIRIVAGFDVTAGETAVPFPTAVVHAPGTRAALHAAVLDVHAAPSEAAPQASIDDQEQPLRGLRVLLAEDNAINQAVAVALLDYAGASVTVAANGRVAVDLLAAGPASFDVVLMDVQMPEMDGLAATRALRGTLGLDLPVVAMTAGVTQEERDACSAAGMDGFIAKPIEEEELIAVLRRVPR